MKKQNPLIKKFLLLCHIALYPAFAQNVTISINATQNKRLISPYIYGRNQTFDKPDIQYAWGLFVYHDLLVDFYTRRQDINELLCITFNCYSKSFQQI